MPSTKPHHSLTLLVLVLAAAAARADDWPQWRGPSGNSTSTETSLPVAWNAELGVAWRTPIPEWGTSTPAIWLDAVFATTQHDDDLLVLKLDRRTGEVVWQRAVGRSPTVRDAPKRKTQKFHQLHNLASPSPVTNGRVVVVHFGNGDLAAYTFDGHQLWHRNLQDDYGAYTIWWGHANSPVIYRDMVVSVCMQDSRADVVADGAAPAESYLVAHDLETGRERWKSTRMTGAAAEEGDAYTTPILVDVDGGTQLLVMGANHLDAYEPATGQQRWVIPGLVGGRTVTGPTAAAGLVYITRGMKGDLVAIDPESAGAGPSGKPSADAIVWKYDQGTPDTPCPVVWHEWLFTVTDDGVARSFDAHTGKLHWKQRIKGNYKASPLAGEGRVYFLNTEGLCTVVTAGPRFERLSENQLPDETLASPAVASGHLLIRGRRFLWAIGPGAARP